MADAAMRAEVEAANIEFVTWCRAPIGIAADPTNISDMGDWARQSAIVHEMEAIVAARRGARTAVQKALRA
jgi:hypothetical protein